MLAIYSAVKKLAGIFLLILLLFNIAGYYGIFLTAWLQNDQSMMAKFDADNYNAAEVKTFKIPISLPYPIHDSGFKRVDGIFEHKGEFYRLIKTRYHQDTLQVVCFKDTQLKNIQDKLVDYVKTFTDKPVDAQSNTKTKIDFIKVYMAPRHSSSYLTAGWTYTLPFTETTRKFQSVLITIPSPPPEG